MGLAAVLVAAAIAYQPAMPGPFVLDDWGSIQANGAIRVPGAVRVPSLPELLGPGRPITEVTFALDWRAARLDPVRFHRVGLALHLLATLLAYAWMLGLLRRAGHPRPRALALVVAGAFALHPIQAESVAYAAQRAEVLSALFTLAALVLLDRAAAAWPGWRAGAAWSGGVLAWIVGMGAKTTAICTPGAFVLDQVVVGEAGDRPGGSLARRALRALLLAAPLLALAAWSATLHFRSFAANPGGGAGTGATLLGPWTYFLTQLRVTWLYLRLLAWPDALAFDRTFAPSDGADAATLAAAAAWLLVVGLAVLLWVRAERASGPRPASRLAAFGILFWFVALSPTSSFVPVADLAVEHRVYLASLGPLLAAAVGIDALLQRLLPRPRAAVAGAALAGDRPRGPGRGAPVPGGRLRFGGGALARRGGRVARQPARLDQPGALPAAGRQSRRGRGGLLPRLARRPAGEPDRQPGPQPRVAPAHGEPAPGCPRRRRPGDRDRPRRPLAARQPRRRAREARTRRRGARGGPPGRGARAVRPAHAQRPRAGALRERRPGRRARRVPGRGGARPGQPALSRRGRPGPGRARAPGGGLRGPPARRRHARPPPPSAGRRPARRRARVPAGQRRCAAINLSPIR